jgi:hypothetical protein
MTTPTPLSTLHAATNPAWCHRHNPAAVAAVMLSPPAAPNALLMGVNRASSTPLSPCDLAVALPAAAAAGCLTCFSHCPPDGCHFSLKQRQLLTSSLNLTQRSTAQQSTGKESTAQHSTASEL